ncbi:MAG TPA: hypothetical protein VKI65_17520 [Gemmataceae bacterium]|nr:hypothetical protein [Gemmataceae bacterium]
MFPIIRVDSRRVELLEQLGTKRKFWYRADDGTRMLFKAEERGTGEDWAEKVACELCTLLGLPHVHYELAHDEPADVPGVVCATCAPPPWALGLGNQLLLERDPAYPEGSKYKVRGHTVDAVASVVRDLQMPPAAYCAALPPGIDSALAVFAGYVLLDAWIANQDRHHENWGALRDPSGLYLAPTFDHGASLARNVLDTEKKERLESRDRNQRIPIFVRRARSAFYADPQQAKPMTTVAAWQAFAQLVPSAGKIWLDKVHAVSRAAIETIITQVPPSRMSSVCREFTLEMLQENQNRLVTGEIE